MSQFFASGHRSTGVSASASVLPTSFQLLMIKQYLHCSYSIHVLYIIIQYLHSHSFYILLLPLCIFARVLYIVSVQFGHSVISDSVTSWTAACQASLHFTISQSLLKLMSVELTMPSKHLCRPLLLLLSLFPSIRVFSNGSALHLRWPKYWSFSFIISPSNEFSGLISCRIDWFDLLAVQGTLKSLLQHHSSKASIRSSAFFIVQLSHPYMTTGKNHNFDCMDLCRQSDVSVL